MMIILQLELISFEAQVGDTETAPSDLTLTWSAKHWARCHWHLLQTKNGLISKTWR